MQYQTKGKGYKPPCLSEGRREAGRPTIGDPTSVSKLFQLYAFGFLEAKRKETDVVGRPDHSCRMSVFGGLVFDGCPEASTVNL